MADSSRFFTPFVEAIVRRQSFPTTHTSGSDTTAIDHLRQGIEITNEKYKYSGMLPKLGTGDDEHKIDSIVFGQSQEFNEELYFEEIVKFDPVVYINNQNVLMYPIILSNASLSDPERFGGFIEPLTIGSRDLLPSVVEFEPNAIRGHIMTGNEDSFKKIDKITNVIRKIDRIQTRDLVVDASSTVGTSGSISIVGYFPDDEKLLDAFNESRSGVKSITSGVLSAVSSLEIRGILQIMSGASTDGYVAYGDRSLGTGFTYDFNQLGVDSIAYGGLKRS